MPDKSFDLIILGGGTGGYVAAIRAAQLGLKTALVEKEKVGGTCLHQGCIPTKALLHTAELLHQFHHGDQYGLVTEAVRLDYPKTMSYKSKVVTQLFRGVQALLKKNGVEVFDGWGRLTAATQVVLSGPGQTETTLTAKDVIVATGSVPRALPNLAFDGRRVLSSDDVLKLETIPKSILILGGGAIGVEFASMYNDFGSDVTLVEMLPHILPQDDEEIAAQLSKMFTARKIRVMAGTKLSDIVVAEAGVQAKAGEGDKAPVTLKAECLLVAIGRSPASEGIGLEALGVQLDRGFVRVDDHYRTNVPHLYAIGDVNGGYLLAHVAAHEGMIAVETIAGANPELLSPQRVPRVTYCRPEVASLGWTAEEAKAAGHTVKTGTFPFRGNGRALILGQGEGLVKLVADAQTDTLLGAHLIGPNASELINEVALARFLEGTAWEMAESVHAHPTVSEVLHEAALAVDGHAIHI